ncbi:MAG: asparagine--tRNA ligase [Coxiellaceae bacterium]|nr:asparagine--tRNA ligase [Coxiellaceae bacterium]
MKQINTISDLLNGQAALNSTIKITGWVRTRRDSKTGISFIDLSDGSCLKPLQIVADNSLFNYQTEILRITTGCSIMAIGKLIQSSGNGQLIELHAEKIEIIGWIENPNTYPITPKYHTLEYLREYAHLRPRTNIISAITRIRHHLSMAIHRFFHERGFYWIHTPIITSSDCEGAGQMLRVTTLDLTRSHLQHDGNIDFSDDFFNHEAFLTVSGQLNAEAYCEALTKVYTFGPTFRAENSNTSRHLAEFWMVEPEVAFADLNDNSSLAVEMIYYLVNVILKECKVDILFFVDKIANNCIDRLEKLIDSKFIYMEYGEAIKYLEKSKKKFKFPIKWGLDLQSEHERYLTEDLIHGPVILINYPKEIKSFYMRINDDNKTVAAMDILLPGVGEIIGGSQREERFDVLSTRMDELGLNKKNYQWYLDLRRYGTVPHAGFGLGLERMLMYITGIRNIRDTIPFPRTVKCINY